MSEQLSTAGILIIGAEILSGKIQDQNGPYLIEQLRRRGVALEEIRVLDDVLSTISQAVKDFSARFTHVITTGGIGPTHDDVTMAAVADAFGREIVTDPTLEDVLRARHGDDLNDAMLRLAQVPKGADVVCAEGDLSPTVVCENVVILPGVPKFMRQCFSRVASRFVGSAFVSQAIEVSALESEIADALARAQASYPEVAIGSYPRFDNGTCMIRVTFDGRDADAVQSCTNEVKEALGALVVDSTQPG